MPGKTAKYVPHCQICQRVQNDTYVRTEMRKPGVIEPLRICAAQGCWDEATARGYRSKYQQEADHKG
jgi:hypothetical protein